MLNVALGFLLTGVVGGILTNHYAAKQRELDFRRSQDQRMLEIEREERTRRQMRAEELILAEQQRQSAADERRWQAKRSFDDELNKIRITKIAEVWEHVFEYEASFSEAMRLIVSIGVAVIFEAPTLVESLGAGESEPPTPRAGQTMKELRRQADELLASTLRISSETHKILDRNRLWLGEQRYRRIREYLAVTTELLNQTQAGKIGQAELKRRQVDLRDDFATLRDDIWRE